jgi:RNA polymerase sigma factor (sigma-70 family)
MDDSQGEHTRNRAAEELILRTIAAHADSLLRTARRHSICADDAQDAYQRAIEIFMSRAHRLDSGRAAGWLHVVVKREAQAIRRSRQKLLLSSEVDLDGREASSLPTPEEQLLRFDTISRTAEALKRLKPHELRALWLRAQGHSYSDIGALTGWSYSKVNRCLTEGRRAFLERYEGIESGAECARWLPVISAMVDGEASAQEVVELRPHLRNCPGCRATLRALQDSSKPLAALLPVPLVVVDGGSGDHVVNVLLRVYEAMAGGLHERAVHSLTKTQALIEASAAGKVAAVAASAAAFAGGGYASVQRIADHPHAPRGAAATGTHVRAKATAAKAAAPLAAPAGRPVIAKAVAEPTATAATSPPPPPPTRDEFGAAPAAAERSGSAPEFQATSAGDVAQARSPSGAPKPAASGAMPAAAAQTAPEFADAGGAAAFGP